MSLYELNSSEKRSDFVFKVETDASQELLRGHFELPEGHLALIGVDKNQIHSCPKGFLESKSGFFFTYLRGTGEKERLQRTVSFPEGTPTFLPMFVQLWKGEGPLSLELQNSFPAANVSIIGGCCTRDTFELESTIRLSEYRARTSFTGLATPALAYLPNSIFERIKSPFQRKMVRGDLLKESLRAVAQAKGQHVIVDFMIERRKIFFAGETLITVSKEYTELGLQASDLPKPVRRIEPGSEEYFLLFRKGWRYAVQQLQAAGKSVLVNKIFWASQNDEGKPFNPEMIAAGNEHLGTLYEIIREETPDVQWIEYPDDLIVADSNHKWGQSPYHFTHAFYEAQLSQIEKLVYQVDSNQDQHLVKD